MRTFFAAASINRESTYDRHGPAMASNLSAVKPTFDHPFGRPGEVVLRLGAPVPAVRIHAHPVPARPAEQPVDRLAEGLADDVPHRLFDAADCAEYLHRPAPLAVVVVGNLREVLDVERVAPDEVPL